MREAALRAAIELIAQQGYAATSMAQVAAAAGISPSGLAHHFPSKNALLGAVLDHRDAEDTFVRERSHEPWSAFDHMVHVARRNMGRRRLVALYMTMIGEAVAPEHPAHAWMVRHYADVLDTLRDQLRADQQRGTVREDAPVEAIARSMVSLMDGLQVQWLLDESVDMAAVLAESVAAMKRTWGTELV
ncbi:TetR family transcriptional regulator [Brachybacterium phenoliresistens]|uniref:TetR family transcriptional regulator n=1 Tax=Brachybacterium phenoliresistens TaxID=396014 RepID=Z9JS13_9MICO|nr:TetR family transcriptional regulator [Brachybacterium phenoliresistens]